MASTSEDLFAAIEAGDAEAVRTILAEDPALATTRDGEGVSALMRARYRLDRGLTEAVKAHVPDLDVFEAAAFGDLDRLSELLTEDRTRVASWSADGFTPLHFAAFFGQEDAARLLIGRGADVDARGAGWMTGTPLNSATSRRRATIAELLLDAGADVDAAQTGGFTSLHSAAHNADPDLTRLLLARGADAALTTDDGRTALSLAEETGDHTTIALLRGTPR